VGHERGNELGVTRRSPGDGRAEFASELQLVDGRPLTGVGFAQMAPSGRPQMFFLRNTTPSLSLNATGVW